RRTAHHLHPPTITVIALSRPLIAGDLGQHDPEATDSGTDPSSRPLRPADEPGPPPRVTSINIPVGELKQNVEQVLVSVPRDKLKGHIESFARGNRRQFRIHQLYVEAASSLGIALALGIPLFTAT